MKTYYERNRTEAKRYQKEYYWKNREKILTKRRIRLQEDPEEAGKYAAYQRAYYAKNRDQILAKRATRRQAARNRRSRQAKNVQLSVDLGESTN